MKLKITITTRLVFWITLLVLLLVGAVLFVIQIREAKILKDETEERALIQARYVADANLQSLVRQDWDAVQKYVDAHIDEHLLEAPEAKRYPFKQSPGHVSRAVIQSHPEEQSTGVQVVVGASFTGKKRQADHPAGPWFCGSCQRHDVVEGQILPRR